MYASFKKFPSLTGLFFSIIAIYLSYSYNIKGLQMYGEEVRTIKDLLIWAHITKQVSA